jgi:ABC-type Zn2+ transport system substrate-binding protein/surface adhesin
MSTPIFVFVVTMVIGLPVVLGIGSAMFKHWLEHKQAMALALTAETAERAAQYAAKTERLEQRMAVLERILTDRSTHLGDEIERLRDKPIN